VDVLILDNYDSFTWNLVQAAEALGARCQVHRSDRITLGQVRGMAPDCIILSPGPFGPEQTAVCADVVREFSGTVPILGVCLGMQVIAKVGGAEVRPSGYPVHGKAHAVFHDASGVFFGLPNPFLAARYHSLVVDPDSVPASLTITARTADGVIMGCRIAGSLAEGVMFHPESFLTEHGPSLLANFFGIRTNVV
jgi:anthranilate synthase/aminodeoxychorismate synthase-like glutamine amidotransferase